MTRRPVLLAGVDVGTSRIKAGVYRPDGTAVARAVANTPNDAVSLREAAVDLVARCVARAPVPPVALGVASMAETGVALGADGQPVGPLLGWRDRRAAREADQLSAAVGEASFHRSTGLLPSAKLPLARWAWLRRHQPDVLDRMRTWASAADLVAAALTGTVATDATLAGRTGAYDLASGRYLPELLERAGLRTDQLPPIAPLAAVDRNGATRSGLPAGTPVLVAGHDHLVAAFAAGVRGPQRSADSMGTAEAIVTPVTTPPAMEPLRQAGISLAPFPGEAPYCLVSGSANCGGVITWWARGYDAFGAPGGEPTGIVVQPYLSGRAAPMPDPHRRLSVHHVDTGHTPADLSRAVLEGICYHARWMLETQAAAVATSPAPVIAFGGPAANPTLMWLKAQLSPAPLAIAEGVDAAVGAAQLAARALDLPHPPVATRPVPRSGAAAEAFEAVYRTRFLPLATTRSQRPDLSQGAP